MMICGLSLSSIQSCESGLHFRTDMVLVGDAWATRWASNVAFTVLK